MKKPVAIASGVGISALGFKKRSGKTFAAGYVLTVGESVWLVWPVVHAKGVFYGIFPDKDLGRKASLLVGKAAKKGRKYRRTLVRRKRRES